MSVPPWLKNSANRLAAGVEISVLGGLLALGLMAVLGAFSGMRWYRYGNLLSIGLYPPTVFNENFGYWSLAGFALGFLYFVVAGLLFACILRSRKRGVGPYLAGIAYSLLFFLAGDRLWWQAWSPYLVIYGIQSHLLWSHILFGVTLGLLPARLDQRDLAGVAFEDTSAETPANSESL